jgi:hypothetical protein
VPGSKEAVLFESRRTIVMLVAAAAAFGAGPAKAQEDLTRGKTPAQLYASDCAECHRNPRALGNRSSAYSLAGFLRVHYTASRESASALANYLVGLGPDPRAGSGRASPSSRTRPAGSREERKSGEASKPTEQPTAAEEAKPVEEAPKPPQPVPQAPASAPAAETPAPAATPPADPQ